jgi:uncharacterized membrane protein YeaQ/YmgE (transglycosylase-associated protein family)
MEFLWFAAIGIVAGFLAGQIMKGHGFGLVGNLIVGVAGAFLGGFLSRMVGVTASSLFTALLISTVGAVLLLFIVGERREAAPAGQRSGGGRMRSG